MKKNIMKKKMKVNLFLFLFLFFSACESPYMVKHPVSPGDIYYLNATFYGGDFNGKKAADGSVFDENEMTCAARGFPFGTYLLVQSVKTGKSVVVKVTDRPGRNVIDLSKKAFSLVDDLSRGKIKVKVKVVERMSQVENREVSAQNELNKGNVEGQTVFYTIELASFDDLEKAKEFQKTLGAESYIFAVKDSVFKVRVGRFTTKDDAQKLLNEKFNGKKADIVEVNE